MSKLDTFGQLLVMFIASEMSTRSNAWTLRGICSKRKKPFSTISSQMRARFNVSKIALISNRLFPVDNSVSHRYVKKGDYYPRLRNRKKHPIKLHIWGGISARGKTPLVMFSGTERMNSIGYQKIIQKAYVPYNKEKHNGT